MSIFSPIIMYCVVGPVLDLTKSWIPDPVCGQFDSEFVVEEFAVAYHPSDSYVFKSAPLGIAVVITLLFRTNQCT